MIVKNKEQMKILVEGGQRLAEILNMVAKEVKPGVNVKKLNEIAETEVKKRGDRMAFLNYKPEGATRPYPAGLCVSVNDEAVHGIPNEKAKVLEEGDIVTLDMGLIHEGLVTDSAITVGVGGIDEKGKALIEVTKGALDVAIESAREGNKAGLIGANIESYVKSKGFIPAEGLGGHGVGESVHEEPYMPNIGPKDRGPRLRPGMVIAIEPIINEGTKRVYLDKDGYTLKTADGKRSAQFEHTVLITDDNPIILTKLGS
ncbi:MAG TPA: type I methionyl aminopeptidase [Candidatus Paceibacterota bacterium]|jgi:methionyl aminopeptidase|nr:type I methionyl aminopeptidase [Parcubacteria group bacterium]MDP6119422.1 type I methionyl aminopeptidase [Candidatus Paceibacterota bacterium]HJN63055.1 type I methionyl aminopeptidase [Candidatus Paceibacterota bacterium]|tara:strand:- start:2402 stop:3175 length:774 start_codon:yes stop_codon:yes gene_type:complete